MSVPKDQQDKRQFLEDLATQYKFYGDTRTAFLGRFAPENADKLNNQLVLTWTKDLDNKEQKLQDELRKIYPVLRENGYDIPETQRGRYKKGESPWEIVYEWLWEVEFPEWKQAQTEPEKPSEILKRCVLGLKGNYQEAQQKITEITQHLQTFLKDNSLSITVEEGSIIIIVESSQTDYDQIKKRLIGQEIAGFAVEYVIDEWQDVCRRMLKKQTQLSVNNLLKAQFNRNLIEEELFIDLALVQPKRDRNEQHKQNIDPDRGSQFYTQQEVEKRFAYSEFLQEVINQRKQKNIAIIGEPGAGKTTLLQKLAFWLLQETDDLVIWISLGELGEKPLGDYLQEKWLKDALMDTRDEIKADWEQKFKRGAVWLLLDGLDEMGDTARQSLKFQGWVTQAQLIISCRLNLWQANPSQLQDFKTYLTQPFQDEQIQQFIQRWFRNLSEEKPEGKLAESFWSALQTSGKERIKDLCRNPLRLTLLSSIWQDEKGNLPDTTAELYQSFVDYIYKWKKQEFPMKKAERDSLNAGLGELGKASLDCEEIRFRLTHRFVCKYLGEPDENSLFDSALKLGWLNEVGVAAENPRERVYAFYHATFQEYFAALAVDDWDYFLPKDHKDCPVAGKEYRIFEPQWKQVILLWLGRGDVVDEEKEDFIWALVGFDDGVRDFWEKVDHLLKWVNSSQLEREDVGDEEKEGFFRRAIVEFQNRDRDFYGYQAYFLAAAAINEFKTCSLADEIVHQVVQWGIGKFNTKEQELQTFVCGVENRLQKGARKAIPETIRPLAITEVTAILKDCPDEDTRWQAAEILGQIDPGNPEAVAALVNLIDNSENEYTRWQEVESLGKIGQGNPDAIAALVNLITTTEDGYTWRKAAESLRKIGQGNPEAIAALVNLIDNSEDERTRKRATGSLLQIDPGNPEAVAALVNLIDNSEDERTRKRATGSLLQIDPGNPEAVAALVNFIDNSENEDTRRQAAEILGQIDLGNPEAVAALVNLIDNSEDGYTRRQAVESLGKIDLGNPEVIATLVNLIDNSEDQDTRRQAAESLGKIDPGNPEAIAALVNLIDNTEDERTRRQAAESLGKIDPGNPEAIAALVNLIDNTEDEYTWRRAARSLGKIGQGNPEAIAVLVKFISTTEKVIDNFEDEDTRHLVAESLGKIDPGNPEAIAALVNLIATTESGEIRHDAAESLLQIDPSNPQAIAAFVKLIATTEDDKESQSIRYQALRFLGAMLTTQEQYAGVVSALKDYARIVSVSKDNVRDEVLQNNLQRFWVCYTLIWNCAQNLPYPDFYRAWHGLTETQTSPLIQTLNLAQLPQLLQNLPIFCLNAYILATETDTSEIAQTLCQLIWEEAFPDQDYPKEVTTASKLREHLKKLKLTRNQPKLNLLLTHCEHPTDELIAFCHKLTNILSIAWLTDKSLEAPLKGFPPHQPNLLSAIQTWLEET